MVTAFRTVHQTEVYVDEEGDVIIVQATGTGDEPQAIVFPHEILSRFVEALDKAVAEYKAAAK